MMWLLGGASVLCIALVWGGFHWPQVESSTEVPADLLPLLGGAQEKAPARTFHPLVELLKLVVAASMAIVVTYLNRRFHGDRPLGRSLEQAQILLCVAGAMMMIIIGNSVARALGIAGVAGIIRFRTPVEDPKDSVILFLLLALGMSVGLGMFAVGGLVFFFLCLFLVVLHHIGETAPHPMMLHVGTELEEFPTAFVQSVFMQRKIRCEPREIGEGAAKFFVMVPPETNLEAFNFELLNHPGNFVSSVEWAPPPKKKKGEDN